MSRMTAEKARDIARAKDPAFAVDAILADIARVSEKGEYGYRTRAYGFGDGACHCEEKKWPELCKAIVKELRGLGYRCEMGVHYGQFADMWLEVRWDEVKP